MFFLLARSEKSQLGMFQSNNGVLASEPYHMLHVSVTISPPFANSKHKASHGCSDPDFCRHDGLYTNSRQTPVLYGANYPKWYTISYPTDIFICIYVSQHV